MKKFIALMVAAVMLLVCMPAMAATEEVFVGEWYMMWSVCDDGEILVTGDYGDISVFAINADHTFSHKLIKQFDGGVVENLRDGTWEINADGRCILTAYDGAVYEADVEGRIDPEDGSEFACMKMQNGSYLDMYSREMGMVYIPVRFGGYHETAVEADFEGTWVLSGRVDFDDGNCFYSDHILDLYGLTVMIADGNMTMWNDNNSEFPEFTLPITYAGADSEGDVFMYADWGDGEYILFYMDASGECIDGFGLTPEKMLIFSREDTYPTRPAIIDEAEAK